MRDERCQPAITVNLEEEMAHHQERVAHGEGWGPQTDAGAADAQAVKGAARGVGVGCV